MEMPGESVYTDGTYLNNTKGTWHLEHSTFKAKHVARMLARHPEIQLSTICEIGCGAGGILSELQGYLPSQTTLTGYEISPQAHALSARFESARCHYILGDAFADPLTFDLALVMDVVEHVDDCFSFLRRTRLKARFKLYHIPLETYATAVLRGLNSWDTVHHRHLFTIETALKSVEYTGHRLIDWMFTDAALTLSGMPLRTHLTNLVRRPLAKVSVKLAVRLFGGFSMLILAE